MCDTPVLLRRPPSASLCDHHGRLVTENVGFAAAMRRRVVTVAGHRGDTATIGRHLVDPSAAVRAAALTALARANVLDDQHLVDGLADPDPAVRRRSAELSATRPGVDLVP